MDAVVWSWLAKELGKKDLEEVKAAASCKGLVELAQLAESLGPKSRLYLHLKDRKFEACDPKAVPAQPIRKKIGLLDVSIKIPLVHVKAMKKRSGTPTSGAQARFHKLDVLKRPAAAKKCKHPLLFRSDSPLAQRDELHEITGSEKTRSPLSSHYKL